jgi:hypothetical protein
MASYICTTWDESKLAREAMTRAVAKWNRESSMPLYFVGYNCISFDCPTMEIHQRLDGLPVFGMDIRKYGSKNIIDLYDLLTFGGNCGTQVMRRTLPDMAKAFGIWTPPDRPELDGSQVAAAIAEGRYEDVAYHCERDVMLTARLYRRVARSPFRAVVFDLETVPKDGLDIERVKVDSRLKDPAKIAAAKQDGLADASLDPYGNRIVVLSWTMVDGDKAEELL